MKKKCFEYAELRCCTSSTQDHQFIKYRRRSYTVVILLHPALQLVTHAYYSGWYYTPVCGFVKPSKVLLHTSHLDSPQVTSELFSTSIKTRPHLS